MGNQANLTNGEQLWQLVLPCARFTHPLHVCERFGARHTVVAQLYIRVKEVFQGSGVVGPKGGLVVDFIEAIGKLGCKEAVQVVLSLGEVRQWQPDHQDDPHAEVGAEPATVGSLLLLPIDFLLLQSHSTVEQTWVSHVVLAQKVHTLLLLRDSPSLARVQKSCRSAFFLRPVLWQLQIFARFEHGYLELLVVVFLLVLEFRREVISVLQAIERVKLFTFLVAKQCLVRLVQFVGVVLVGFTGSKKV